MGDGDRQRNAPLTFVEDYLRQFGSSELHVSFGHFVINNLFRQCFRLDDNQSIRITDYSLCQEVRATTGGDLAAVTRNGKIGVPFQWLAPECIAQRSFSIAGDVVSTIYLYLLHF